MGPRGKKKKTIKKVISSMEESIGKNIMNKMGMNADDSENSGVVTPRQDTTDDNIQDTSYYSEHKEEDEPEESNKKTLNTSGDNIDTKTTVTVDENKESN